MKRIRIIAVLVLGIMLCNTIAAHASNISIDTKNAKEGILRVSYTGINKKTKVMVQKGSNTYYYDLKKEEDYFPLQFGQGEYTVAVLENTSDTKYRVLTKKSFKADIAEENSVYLKSTQPILWNKNMEAIKLAKSLTQDEQENEKVVQVIYDYIIENITYDNKKVDKLSSDYIPEIDEIIKDGSGICYDYSVLFAAMLRSREIPTKLAKGYKKNIKDYHAWNEVYIDGSWKIIDTTYDVWMKQNRTSYTMIKDKNEYNKLKEF